MSTKIAKRMFINDEDRSKFTDAEWAELMEYRAFPAEGFRVKKIGEDFELVQRPDGFWAIVFYSGDKKCSLGASDVDIALWKSREAMYALFAEVFKAASAGDANKVKEILLNSKLDKQRIGAV